MQNCAKITLKMHCTENALHNSDFEPIDNGAKISLVGGWLGSRHGESVLCLNHTLSNELIENTLRDFKQGERLMFYSRRGRVE